MYLGIMSQSHSTRNVRGSELLMERPTGMERFQEMSAFSSVWRTFKVIRFQTC